jgi:menaquinone-9 beta-reductase
MFLYIALAAITAFIYYSLFYRKPAEKIPAGTFSDKLGMSAAEKAGRGFYDVIIVGAGPSGSTCGYFLGKAGAHVLVLDKAKLGRDKYCGDAVCKTAIEILREMDIYNDLIKRNKAKIVRTHTPPSPLVSSRALHSLSSSCCVSVSAL